MIHPLTHYLMEVMQAPPDRHRLPRRPRRPSLRGRLRTFLTRTTLGPRMGDHVLGDSQWNPRPAGR